MDHVKRCQGATVNFKEKNEGKPSTLDSKVLLKKVNWFELVVKTV